MSKSCCNRTMPSSAKGAKGLMIAVIFPVLALVVIAQPIRVAAEAEEKTTAAEKDAQVAGAKPKPTPTPTPSSSDGFGRINTKPIKDQIQRLYQAQKDSKLNIPGKFKVGVSGSVNPDGTLAKYEAHISSGIPEIDQSAMDITAAVSESRALGAFSKLTSVSWVLDIDQNATLIVTGFAKNETDAVDIRNLVELALMVARIRKADDQAIMVIFNNVKIIRKGTRIDAVISVPKGQALETLANSMEKK
jgi:hypothetical protein